MTRGLALAAIVVAVSACGESKPPQSPEHLELAKLCVDGGGEQPHCECQATKVDELLAAGEISPQIQRALILQAQGKEDEADAIMLSLPYDERFEHSSLVAARQLECETLN
ncbi:MAG: hypothetical protein IPO30_10500 [Hyphomonadaceae bacterium]|jgi:hypothetical protein|nr:hypothetical protein [Hyphomonadaceae bacterium]